MNNAFCKNPISRVVYEFLKRTSFRTISWYLLFYGSVACTNTITQRISSCVRHSLQSATNIF